MPPVELILGSGSPRRKELISEIWSGPLHIIKSDIEENYPPDLPLEHIPLYLAKLKGEDLKTRVDRSKNILVTADTIVICQGQVLGKPKDTEDARRMLQMLSNKVHQVHTGVAIYYKDKIVEVEEKTEVYFGELDLKAINYYIHKYQPMDKAGSYGIQEFIGMIAIRKINGCFYNVMGLPTHRIWKELNKIVG